MPSAKIARFVLQKPNSSEPTYITLTYTCTDGTLKHDIGQKVLPEKWERKTQRPIRNKELKDKIEEYSDWVDEFTDNGKKPVSKKQLKNWLQYKEGKVGVEVVEGGRVELPAHRIFSLIKADAESGKLLNDGARFTKGTLKAWARFIVVLKDFETSLKLSQVSLETYHQFISFCNGKGHSINYVGSLIKTFKSLFNQAVKKGYTDNLIYRHEEFRKPGEASTQIYLTDEDISKLLDYKCTGMDERIRDRFVINTFVGLRISDMKKLTIEHINNDVITITNQKTRGRVSVPVSVVIKDILRKYKGELPRQYAEQKVNERIKEIAKAAGITDRQEFFKTVGGEKKLHVKEKWEMITNHTARRTTITKGLESMTIVDLQPMVGLTLKTLDLYNKRTAERNAELNKTNKFFSQRPGRKSNFDVSDWAYDDEEQ